MKFKAAALVVCVFLTGAVVGGLAVHVFGDRIWSTRASSANTLVTRDELLQQLSQQLSLTPEQRSQIKGIMDQTISDWHRIYLTVNPELEQARQQGRQRIRGVLSPDQLPKFDLFIRNLDEQRAKAEQQQK
jgi:Spy/CpxP family protein refolding chaperone